jgi:hypothetical protein
VHLVAVQFGMKYVQSGRHWVRESVTPFHWPEAEVEMAVVVGR